MTGPMWVDPERVTALGDRYGQHGAMYDQFHSNLQSLRDRHGGCWGHDDAGRQFADQFVKGMDALGDLVRGVKVTLDATAEGLRTNGKMYSDAGDDTNQQAGRLDQEMQDLVRDSTTGSSLRPGTPIKPEDPSAPFRPLNRLAPAKAAEPPDPAVPPTSGPMLHSALPHGYRLRTLQARPDGSVVIDMSQYDSVVPIGRAEGPDRDFLLQPRTDAAPRSQRPMLVAFHPDGTTTPVTDPH